MMDNFAKHQCYVTDRLRIYEEKFKSLSKDTYEMTKDLSRNFHEANGMNEAIKNELVIKMKNLEGREKILDLYVTERE